MQIDFYEEFPTNENLQKLKLVKHPTRVYVTAKSVEEFKKIEKKIKQIKKDTYVAYWPIIPNSYWISPFANPSDLDKTLSELNKLKNHILIDLEFPKNKKLIIKNIPHFFRNKRKIKQFFQKNKEKITAAEFPTSIMSPLIRFLGLDYNVKTEKSLMWYSSMNSKLVNNYIKRHLNKIKDKENYSISLGTIAIGILGNEPILPLEKLEKDLEFVKNSGFKKAVIFRLGGLNKDYINIIDKFQSKNKREVDG